MGALTTAYVAVLPDMKRFGPELRVGLRKVDVSSAGRDAGNRFGSSFHSSSGKLLKRGLVGTGVAAGAAFGAALTKGFGRLSAIENATAKLTGLGHSAKTVDKIMVNALASVKGTAFGLDEAATIAAGAVAAGIEPGRKLQKTLKLVADAATIGGTSLNEMGAIFNQVAASNKVQGDTINQLNERGIPILKLLGQVMGKSQGQVSALASKGKIDFATFQKAMEKGLGGAALKSGNTATGAFKNMGAAFSRVGAALLKGVFPQMAGGFGTVTKFLDRITPAAGRFGETFGAALTEVGGGFRAFGAAFRAADGDVTSSGFPGMMERLANLLVRLKPLWTEVTGGFRAFGAAFRAADGDVTSSGFAGFMERLANLLSMQVVPALRQFGDYVRANVLPALKSLGSFVLTTLLPAWLSWYRFLFAQLMPILKQVGGFIVTSVVPAFRVVARFIAAEVVPGFLSIVETVKALIRVVAPIIGQLVGVILGKFREMSPEVKSIWGSVKEIIVGVMFIVKEVISSVTEIIRLIWSRWGTQIKAIVGSVFGAIFKTIAGVMKTIAGVIKLFVALIKGDWKGAWNAIKQIFAGIWQVIKAILGNILTQIRTVIDGTLTKILTKWVGFWTGIKTKASDAMSWVHTKITGVLGRIGAAFQTAKDNIGRVWSGVKGVVSAPIEWVKNNVYNRPLVPVWNRVAGLVNGPKLSTFAKGGIDDSYGIRPGYTPGRDTHLIAVGGGEPVLRPEAGRALGRGWVDGVNRSARTGGVSGVQSFLSGGGQGFAGGGIVGWIKNSISGAGSAIAGLAGKMKDWALGGLRDAAAKVLSPLRAVIRSQLSGSGVRTTAGGIANKALDLILDKIKASDAVASASLGGGGPVGGGGYAKAEAWARTQIGKPYGFAGVGPRIYDCSGFVGAIQNVIQGRAPHHRIYSSGSFLGGPHSRAGLTRDKRSPFMVGVIPTGQNGGRIGHMAATLNGRNFESAGGVGTRSGVGARGWNAGLFKYHYGMARGGMVGDFAFDTLDPRGQRFDPASRALIDMLYNTRVYDRGGELPPGLSLAMNKTGKSEVVRPGGGKPITINIDLGDGVAQRVQGILDENDEFRAGVGRMRR